MVSVHSPVTTPFPASVVHTIIVTHAHAIVAAHTVTFAVVHSPIATDFTVVSLQLVVPYLAWVAYATTINAGVVALN